MNEVVAAFEQAKREAIDLSDWRLKVRIWFLRREVRRDRSEANQARLVATEFILTDRVRRSLKRRYPV